MGIVVSGTAVVTRRGMRRAVRGRPWLGPDDVVSYEGDGGPFVDLVDETTLPLGTAVWDPSGVAPVRLLASARTRDPVALLRTRLERADARRRADLDGAEAYRLCHGEADGVPGVFIDRLGLGLVVRVECAAMKGVVDELLPALLDISKAATVALATPAETRLAHGDEPVVRWLHGSLGRSADLRDAHTANITEHLQAQRALRRFVKARVLDAYSKDGGFGLQLADAGADEVTFLDDDSPLALSIQREAQENQLRARIRQAHGDPLAWCKDAAAGSFDVVVWQSTRRFDAPGDPATSSARIAEHAEALLRLLGEGGVLAAAPQSSALDDAGFAEALQEGAARLRRRLLLLARLGPGLDHPGLAGEPLPPSLLVLRVVGTT